MIGDGVSWYQRRRYWLAGLMFCGFSIFTIVRANLSIIIVCMVKHGARNNLSHVTTYNASDWTNSTHGTDDILKEDNGCPRSVSGEVNNEGGEFEWDKELQGVLLGGFFWGYSCGLQVLGGWLCQRYGTRKMLALGMLPSAIGSLLSPVSVRVSPYLFLAVRIISGAGITVIFASAPVFWSRWAPPGEWGRLLSFSLAGGEFGHAVAFPINGLLCSYGGWELPFYVIGGVSLTWIAVWFAIVRDSPAEMTGIADSEKRYIEEAIGERVSSKRMYSTPWKRIFLSGPVWACVCAHVLSNFFFYMLLTQGPTYLKEVMNFDIESNGLYSSLPYIALVILIFPVGMASDQLTSRKYLSVGAVRKISNSLGMLIPAIFLLALAHLPCSDQLAGVALITAAIAAFAFCFAGHIVNFADIALMHSGIVAGFSNTLASMPGIVAPYVVAFLTKEGTQEEWRTAFYISVALCVIGAVVFMLFSSGEPQPWALPSNLDMTTTLEAPEKCGNSELTERFITNGDVPHTNGFKEGTKLILNDEGNISSDSAEVKS